jgi:cobaltochelatase CobN
VLSYLQPKGETGVAVVLNTTSFAIAQLDKNQVGSDAVDLSSESTPSFWQRLNLPVLQVILSGGTVEQWQGNWQGLSPRDIAMNVALPEVDGRIITRAVSFKSVQSRNEALETDVVTYEPIGDRIQFVADLAANWARLHQTLPAERKVALILANYPTKDGRLANGVGLDTPTSCVEILKAMQQEGYTVTDIPQTGDELIQRLTSGVTNDPEGRELRPIRQQVSYEEYQQFFIALPIDVQQGIAQRWGYGRKREQGIGNREQMFNSGSTLSDSFYPIAGLQLGNVFVGIQPARGYDQDPTLNYHAPDLEPTHEYLAFYYWLRQQFGVQAIVQVGKHGNLEWLPGKGIALCQACYPEVALGALPHFYPFIVNDPGEGTQAKRRSQAVILDHLTPPMTRAELYGSLQQLEVLIDEYYEAQSLDPSRSQLLQAKITELLVQENLDRDLDMQGGRQEIEDKRQKTETLTFDFSWLPTIDRYLCELKEAQIRDGLHIFGKCPEGRQLRDLIVAIARSAGSTYFYAGRQGRLGITRAIAQDWSLEFDPLTANLAEPLAKAAIASNRRLIRCHTIGDAIEVIETYAAELIEQILGSNSRNPLDPVTSPQTHTTLTWICSQLLPLLQQTPQEIINLLRGLNGEYVSPGASGAPTRGRAEVLPTGRNFYSVDIRAIPTETAWDVGRKAAEILIERYTQEQGEYPQTLGLSIWGTSTMRTGGDDIAEALALLGVQPCWEGGRVVDFEILPLSILGRPRVDVTLRVSGFFRDAFPNLIDLFDQAVVAVAALPEPAEMNPLAAQVQAEIIQWQQAGLPELEAKERSGYRIFSSKPGAYGAGLQGLIDAQNWQADADLARAYVNWSSYAYTYSASTSDGLSEVFAPEAFEQRLQQMQIVLHNQDNREHDLLDSDDYYQFQGGLTAAVRLLQGQNPTIYFGDHSRPENPQVRPLQAEIARVYRSRVVNPKWIAGMMRHGYKGAFELAATVDYLFAYDATAHCVEDFMYQGIAEAYLFKPEVEAFVQQKNPWALRDMAERLLEAHQRGLWQTVKSVTLDRLRQIALEAEAVIEAKHNPDVYSDERRQNRSNS